MQERRESDQITDRMSLASGRSQKRLLRTVSQCPANVAETPTYICNATWRNRGNRSPEADHLHRGRFPNRRPAASLRARYRVRHPVCAAPYAALSPPASLGGHVLSVVSSKLYESFLP